MDTNALKPFTSLDPFTRYVLPDGRGVAIDASAAKDALVATFQMKGGQVVFVLRADVAQQLQAARTATGNPIVGERRLA